MRASAFTQGTNIIFGAGEYAPGTSEGDRLIAHELVHVVQAGLQAGQQWAAENGPAAPEVRQPVPTGCISRQANELTTPNTDTYSTSELETEIDEILRQLANLPEESSEEINSERGRLEQRYYVLNSTLQSRRTGNREIADVVTAVARVSGAGLGTRIGMAFSAGFGAGALMEYRPADGQRLVEEIRANPEDFGGGILVGIVTGAAADFWSNIIGLAELVLYASPMYWSYRTLSETASCLRDSEACIARGAQQMAQAEALLTGLGELVVLVARDSNFLVDQGEELGLLVGQRAAQWFDSEFMPRSSYAKGETVGMVVGAVIMEIALLFLGPEEWIARGAVAAGQALRISARLERAILRLLERIPSLARLRQLRQASEGAHLLEDTGRAARTGEGLVGSARDVDRATDVAGEVERAVTGPSTSPQAVDLSGSTQVETPPTPPISEVPTEPQRRPNRLGPAHAEPGSVVFSNPSVPTPEPIRRPRLTVDEPRRVGGGSTAGGPEPRPHAYDAELHPSSDELDDLADGIGESSGDAPALGTEIDPGARTIDHPVGSPREGALTGDLGEAIEAAESGARTLPPTHARHLSAPTRADLRQIFSEHGEDALRVFADRLSLPASGLRQVEIPISRGTRKVDRLFLEGQTIVLREIKRYPRSTLRESGRVIIELEGDLELLERYTYARVDWHITGNISAEFLARLEALEVTWGGRFRLVRGSPFTVVP